jgi:hypothetical protein
MPRADYHNQNTSVVIDVHIFYFFPLVELDCIFIFMNGLDNHIRYMVKFHNLKIHVRGLLIGHKL